MPQLRVPKSVRRIAILDNYGTVTIHSNKGRGSGRGGRRRKKSYRWLRPASRWTRTLLRAHAASANDLLRRHQRWDAKKRDGGLRRWHENAWKAGKKAARIIRKQYY